MLVNSEGMYLNFLLSTKGKQRIAVVAIIKSRFNFKLIIDGFTVLVITRRHVSDDVHTYVCSRQRPFMSMMLFQRGPGFLAQVESSIISSCCLPCRGGGSLCVSMIWVAIPTGT